MDDAGRFAWLRALTLNSRGSSLSSFKPGWRNWQTQRTQNPPRFTPRGGSTPPPGTIRALESRGARKWPQVRCEPRLALRNGILAGRHALFEESAFHGIARACHGRAEMIARNPAPAAAQLEFAECRVIERIGGEAI